MPRITAFTIPVEMDDRKFEVTIDGGGAWVPEKLGQFMVAQGLVVRGHESPHPQPRFERLTGGAHGAAIPLYAPWVEEKN
jgi:hypothetical protein